MKLSRCQALWAPRYSCCEHADENSEEEWLDLVSSGADSMRRRLDRRSAGENEHRDLGDILLAARCLGKGIRVIGIPPPFTPNNIAMCLHPARSWRISVKRRNHSWSAPFENGIVHGFFSASMKRYRRFDGEVVQAPTGKSKKKPAPVILGGLRRLPGIISRLVPARFAGGG